MKMQSEMHRASVASNEWLNALEMRMNNLFGDTGLTVNAST